MVNIKTKRTQSDKFLRDKTFKIASNPKYDGYQRGLASMIYKFFDKNSKGIGIKPMSNQQLANDRSSRLEVFLGRGILEICSKFIGEHPCRSVISLEHLELHKPIIKKF